MPDAWSEAEALEITLEQTDGPPVGDGPGGFRTDADYYLYVLTVADSYARLTIAVNDALRFVGAGGVFLPGEFYEIEVDKVAGNQMTSLGHENPEMFWAASAGMEVSF